MRREIPQEYLVKAKSLSRDEAEQVFSRMRYKARCRVEDHEIYPLEAIALQLQKDEENLIEWRSRWAEVKAREHKK